LQGLALENLRSCSYENKWIDVHNDGVLTSFAGQWCEVPDYIPWAAEHTFGSWIYNSPADVPWSGGTDFSTPTKRWFNGKCPCRHPCVNCLEGCGPDGYTVVVAGGTGDFAILNQTFNLIAAQSCVWDYIDNGYNIEIGIEIGVPIWFILLEFYPAAISYTSSAPLYCQQPIGGWVGSITRGVGTLPIIVSVTPY